jgi:hypothetical protein
VLVDGELFLEEARRVYPIPPSASVEGKHTPEELTKYETDLNQIASVIYLLRAIPANFDYERTKDLKITFALLTKDSEGNQKVRMALAILPPAIKEFKRLFEEVHLQNVTKIGVGAIEFTNKLYRLY